MVARFLLLNKTSPQLMLPMPLTGFTMKLRRRSGRKSATPNWNTDFAWRRYR